MMNKKKRLEEEFKIILEIIEKYKEKIDPFMEIPLNEYKRRQKAVYNALKQSGLSAGIVFSDEHYCGDVPYLGGNTNISIEQVAGIIGKTGFHIIAGLEGGYIAEQLASRAGAVVHKAELLQLADEKYPIEAEKLEDVIEAATEEKISNIKKIGLLTPRQVIPANLVEYLNKIFSSDNIIDAQEIYYKIKYEKSDIEMKLIEQACLIADAMMEGMIRVLKPGMLETEVASWAYFIGKQLGSEENGFKVMVGANSANRTLIGEALNRIINKNDYVHLGVAPKRDGLNSCIRRSIIAVENPENLTEEQKYWFNFIEEAYKVGYNKFIEVAAKNLPAKIQEQALVDFFSSKSQEINKKYGINIKLEDLKPYTGTHNSGYTECQEFYGAITLDSEQPLGNQIVTMLDVALRGIGNKFDEVVLPNFDYIVIENTLGKYGKEVKTLTKLPLNCQLLVGKDKRR
ncbi:MAG: M24 family metallopeptidase [Promethearchaeota archaeon]|nr:MAG: M24 family metallopeptidase [Candidatus Lokiarchaeota archaeon]